MIADGGVAVGDAIAAEQPRRTLAASANAFDLSIDVGVLLIDDLPRRGCRCGNIACTGLAVADRRRPGPGCRLFDAYAPGSWTIASASTGVAIAAYRIAAKPSSLKLFIEASVQCPSRLSALLTDRLPPGRDIPRLDVLTRARRRVGGTLALQ